MGRRKKLYILCLLCALTFSSFCFPLSASAFDYSVGLRYVTGLNHNQVYFSDNNAPNSWKTGFAAYGGINTYSSARTFNISNSNRTFATSGGQYIVVTGQFYASSYAGGTVNTSGMMGIGTDDTNCNIIEIDGDDVTMDNVLGDELITYRKNFTLTCFKRSTTSNYFTVNLHLYNGGQESVSSFGVTFTNVYVFLADSTNKDINDNLSDIKSYLNNTLGTKLDGIKNSQDQANSDANDRYQDEKDTIARPDGTHRG